MIIEQVSIVAPPQKREELCRALLSLLGPTDVETGCLSCQLYQSCSDEDTLRLETRWNTRDDLVRHLQSDACKKLLWYMELGARAPIIEFLTVSELKGLELIEAARDCDRDAGPEFQSD
jgi:quinol monooxygenase YgiN